MISKEYELLHHLYFLTRDILKVIEIYEVFQGKKPVARQGYSDQQGNIIKAFLEKNGLVVVASPLHVVLVDASTKHLSYSNKGRFVTSCDTKNDTHDQFMIRFYYISRDELLAQKALLAELQQDDKVLGTLLGYPQCCIAFFKKHKKEKSQTDFDYQDKIAEASLPGTYPFFQNYLLPEKLVSHFPCSLSCKASQEIAQYRWEILRTYFPQEAEQRKQHLVSQKKIKGKQFFFH